MKFKNIASFNPQSCISGKVMRLNRLTANVFRYYLKPFNITDSQLSLLFILSKKGGLNQKQLTDFMQIEKSTLNRNLKRLLERKYLTRINFPIIEITEEGKVFVDKIIPEWEKAMAEIRTLLNVDGEQALDLVLSKF